MNPGNRGPSTAEADLQAAAAETAVSEGTARRFWRARLQPGIREYLLLGLAGLLSVFLTMQAADNSLVSLLTLIVAIPGLLGLWTISPVVFFLLVCFHSFTPLGPFGPPLPRGSPAPFQLGNLLLAWGALVCLAAQYRLLALLKHCFPPDTLAFVPRQQQAVQARPATTVNPNEIPTLVLSLLGVVFLGQNLQWLLNEVELPVKLDSSWQRLFLFLWLFVTGGLLATGIFSYLRLRRASPAEAQRYLEDVAWEETMREQRRIHLWRNWFRQRQKPRPRNARRDSNVLDA